MVDGSLEVRDISGQTEEPTASLTGSKIYENLWASVLSEVQTSRNSQLPTSKNLLVLGKLKKFLRDHKTQIRYVFSRNFCYQNEMIILFIFL